jgi:hypothetical protein
VSSKEEFWYGFDLEDLSNAGAFIDKEIWDKYILEKKQKVTVSPRDYTK